MANMNVNNNLHQDYYRQYKDDKFFNNQYDSYRQQLISELDSGTSETSSKMEVASSCRTDYTDRDDDQYSQQMSQQAPPSAPVAEPEANIFQINFTVSH